MKKMEDEGEYKSIFYAIPDLIFQLTRDGIVLDFKPAKGEELQFPADKILGKNVRDVLPEELSQQAMYYMKEAFKTGNIQSFEYKLPVQSGDIHIYKARVITSGKNRAIVIARDITEQKKVEKTLKEQIEKLKRLELEKSKFISLAAHELKTPMTSIISFSELLQKKKIAGNKKSRNRFLKTIDKEIKRLDRLLTIMLDLLKFEMGIYIFTLENFSLLEFMKEIKKRMQPLARKKKLKLIFDIPNLTITTDKESLSMVVSNLITNAINFTNKGKIAVKAKKDGQFLYFSVADTGIGIDKEYHDKIFERFFQIDPPSTRKIGGVGLGLSLCKTIVESIEGEIQVESKGLGKGSTFAFKIPIGTSSKI